MASQIQGWRITLAWSTHTFQLLRELVGGRALWRPEFGVGVIRSFFAHFSLISFSEVEQLHRGNLTPPTERLIAEEFGPSTGQLAADEFSSQINV